MHKFINYITLPKVIFDTKIKYKLISNRKISGRYYLSESLQMQEVFYFHFLIPYSLAH